MITVSLDTAATRQALGQYADQFPFAVSKALNDLAIAAADEQRKDMQTRFTIRNPNVLKYGIVRTETATKQKLQSAVGISQQVTGSREAFGYLKKFEAGGRKGPIQGTTVAMPEEARRTKRGIVSASERIKALGLQRVGNRVIGKKRTFLIKPKSGRAAALILQAVGRGKRARVKVLYVLERSVPIQPILHLADTARRVAQQQWQTIASKAVALALSTRR